MFRLFPALVFSSLLLGAHPCFAQTPSKAQAVDIEQLGQHVLDNSKRDRIRLKAARVLAESSEPQALDYLFKAIHNTQFRPILRAGFVYVLNRSPRHAEVGRFLVARLSDLDEAPEVRTAAARVLGQQKLPVNLAPLERFTDDPAPEVRLEARNAVLAIGGSGVDRLSLLTATLREREQPAGARAAAARALGELKDRRAAPDLQAALKEEVPVLPAPKVVEELYERAATVKEIVPIAAARALGQIGDPVAAPGLLERASHPEPEMRTAVFEALARIQDPAAVPTARKAMAEDKEQRVRRWAAVLLKEQRDPETLPDFRRALVEDPDPGVRLQAVQALEVMNDRESVERIRTALEKEELKEVRATMEQALIKLSAEPAPAKEKKPD